MPKEIFWMTAKVRYSFASQYEESRMTGRLIYLPFTRHSSHKDPVAVVRTYAEIRSLGARALDMVEDSDGGWETERVIPKGLIDKPKRGGENYQLLQVADLGMRLYRAKLENEEALLAFACWALRPCDAAALGRILRREYPRFRWVKRKLPRQVEQGYLVVDKQL